MRPPFRPLSSWLRPAVRPARPLRARPQLLCLEGRDTPAAFTVTNLLDAGAGSLRDAVDQANLNPGDDTITFDPQTGVGTIPLATVLLVNDPTGGTTTIDGTTGVVIDGQNATSLLKVDIGSSAVVNDLTLTKGNATAGDGGAVENLGTLVLDSCTVSNSTTSQSGGGIINRGSLSVVDSALTGNSAAISGGGLFNDLGATARLINTTIAVNSCNQFGGGIFNGSAAANGLVLINDTVALNVADFNGDPAVTNPGGGLYNGVGAESHATNTLFAGNTQNHANPVANDLDGDTVTTAANVLVGDPLTAGGVFPGIDGNIVGAATNTVLNATLALNGGATATLALVKGSPAIDAGNTAGAVDLQGNPLATDQRGTGFPRVAGLQVDIGAVESAAAAAVVKPRQYAVGADTGSGVARLYNADGTLRFAVTPFAGFTGGVRTASADFNGDGVADLVVGTGPGRATQVSVLDGATQAVLFNVAPFEAAFTGGVYVSAGDLDGDGKAELVVSPDQGGGPRVLVYRGSDFKSIANFFGIDDPAFRGGARTAIGDLDGDGKADLLVAAGFGGGPRVTGWRNADVVAGSIPNKAPLFNRFVFESGLRNGAFVALGDVNGDGFSDLIAGGGPGGGPRVLVLDGKQLILNATQVTLGNFFGGDVNSRGGIRVAAKDLDGDGKDDVIVGAGAGAGSRVTSYSGGTITPTATPPVLQGFDAFTGFTGGVFVG